VRVYWFGIKTKVDDFSRFGIKTSGFRFPNLGIKTGNYGLVIWTSKSPRWFLGLGLNQAGYSFMVVPQNQLED
jgi:hypothetical protein